MAALVGLGVRAVHFGAAASLLDVDVHDVIGWSVRLLRAATRMQGRSAAIDDRALQEMVDLARSRARRRTGRLHEGIEGFAEGDVRVFRAIARRQTDSGEGVDYAPFHEHGTRAGVRGKSFDRLTEYENSRGRGRRSRRTHPGTAAVPFFWNSVREVLERRRIQQEAALARAVAEDVDV